MTAARATTAPRLASGQGQCEATAGEAVEAETFVATAAVQSLARRALAYLRTGLPVHFRGPAGTGKTTLALQIAAQLGRPSVLMVGDDSFDSSNLIGAEKGQTSRRVVDRYVTSVTKIESASAPVWFDQMLTTACAEGYTLIYDEFTRSPPEANNVLLTALEERLLILPSAARGESQIKVHPEFRAILTSNPTDHVGVHDSQDALFDRLVTIDVDYFDRDTEIRIVAARSGLAPAEAAKITDMVRDFRASGAYVQRPTMRASIMIARVAAEMGWRVAADEPDFVQLCLDILAARARLGDNGSGTDAANGERAHKLLAELIAHFCPASAVAEVERGAA